MKEIIRKLNNIRDQILSEKGSLLMFVLIERNDADEKWDILLCADWIEKTNSEPELVYIINKLKEEFKDNLGFLSQIVIGTPTDNFILRIARAINEQGNNVPEEISGLQVSPEFKIQHLFVIAMNFSQAQLANEGVDELGPVAVGEVSKF